MASMYLSPPKLKAILKYFCQNTNSRHLGKTKLMKLFYFLDFTHVKKYGVPITGDTYYHLERGPIPSAIKNLVYSVEGEPEWSILNDTIDIKKSADSKIHQIVCEQEFTSDDADYFSEIELQTMKEVCEKFKNYTTKEIVDASHTEAPWSKTEELEKIPYTLAADDLDCKVSKDMIKLLSEI